MTITTIITIGIALTIILAGAIIKDMKNEELRKVIEEDMRIIKELENFLQA